MSDTSQIPFRIKVHRDLVRVRLPDGEFNPFLDHIIQLLLAEVGKTIPPGSDVYWLIIPNQDRFGLKDIKTLVELGKKFDLDAEVELWSAYVKLAPEDVADSPWPHNNSEQIGDHVYVEVEQPGSKLVELSEEYTIISGAEKARLK